MIQAILFDFDGLILDTEWPSYQAWADSYRAHGHDLPLETYVQCVGSDFARFDPKSHLEELFGDRIDWNHWDRERERLALKRIRELAPLPGVRELFGSAREEGVPCAVASSSPRSWVEGHLSRLGLLPYVSVIRSLDDVAAPKPSPELFLTAAEALGVAPETAVVLEDSLNGLKAAQAARTPCVIVPNRVTSHLDFTGAAAVIPSLEGVDPDRLADLSRGTTV